MDRQAGSAMIPHLAECIPCALDVAGATEAEPVWTPRRSSSRSPTREAARTAAEEPFVNRRDLAQVLGPDGKPAVSRRAPIWNDVPDEKWNDWRWQLSNRVNDLEEIEAVLNLTDEERAGLSAPDKFRVDITPYFISLIDLDDPDDLIRRQVIPLGRNSRPSPR